MKQKLINIFQKKSVIETGTARLSNQLKKINFEKVELMALFAWRVTFINHAD